MMLVGQMNTNDEAALLFQWFAPCWFDAHSRLPGLEVGYQYEVKQDREVGYYIDVEILCYRYNGREIDQQRVEKYSGNRAIAPMLAEEIRQALENDASRGLGS
jgi:hypothetical protein